MKYEMNEKWNVYVGSRTVVDTAIGMNANQYTIAARMYESWMI